jgi:N-acetylglucosaminyldiphosphoundecaprenol N-acetyl-beta-D-mannosaminyltransferase
MMRTTSVIGLPITIFEQRKTEDEMVDLLESEQCVSFHGYSIDTLYLMKTIPNLYEMRAVNDYFLCDGRGYYYFMKILGAHRVRKLSLPALTMMLVSIAAKYNKSIFLLGATAESNQKATEVLNRTHGVNRVEGRNGYFKPEDENEIVKEINQASPDILFLGMSSPKKDEFVYRWKDKLNVKVIVHCGGMIDIISGKTKLYPKWVKDFCLAAIYRFIQEPIRLRRDIANAAKSLFLIIKILFLVKIMRKEYNFPKTLKFNSDE